MVGGFTGAFGGADVIGIAQVGCGIGLGASEGIEVVEDADEDAHGGGEVER
ncbi:MAG: hypothetical protein KF902_11885 [Phycisphaeraceae bacterium]|nr:hypothetical protein [Phycisphaeraceae bacterium]